MMIENCGNFLSVAKISRLSLPLALAICRYILTTHANYMALRIADKVFFERLLFSKRFVMWTRDDPGDEAALYEANVKRRRDKTTQSTIATANGIELCCLNGGFARAKTPRSPSSEYCLIKNSLLSVRSLS